jgi:hypothetical protein
MKKTRAKGAAELALAQKRGAVKATLQPLVGVGHPGSALYVCQNCERQFRFHDPLHAPVFCDDCKDPVLRKIADVPPDKVDARSTRRKLSTRLARRTRQSDA